LVSSTAWEDADKILSINMAYPRAIRPASLVNWENLGPLVPKPPDLPPEPPKPEPEPKRPHFERFYTGEISKFLNVDPRAVHQWAKKRRILHSFTTKPDKTEYFYVTKRGFVRLVRHFRMLQGEQLRNGFDWHDIQAAKRAMWRRKWDKRVARKQAAKRLTEG